MSMLTRLLLLLFMAVLFVWNGKVHAQGAKVNAGISAKLRAEASRSSAVVALLPGGTPVDVHDVKEGYARVSAAGKNGWVAQRLLSMKTMAESRAAPSPEQDARRQEIQARQAELALVREEQEKNTWRMLATTGGVAIVAFLSGFWLRGMIFRQRYGWLSVSDRYRAVRKRIS